MYRAAYWQPTERSFSQQVRQRDGPYAITNLTNLMEPDCLTPAEVEEYLARIHYTGPIEPTIDALSELHRCHMLSVPFENLSVFGKEKIVLSKDWLFDKVVRRHRGGFCCELNMIFSLLLNYFGFKHEKHAGMVFSRKTGRLGPSFDHMILTVEIEDCTWLSDVAFGDSYITPLRFSGSADPQVQQSGVYRIRRDGDDYFVEDRIKIIVDNSGREEVAKETFTTDAEWTPRYKFDVIPRTADDFHERLLYHQTHPESLFTHDRICTIAMPWGRVTLAGSKVVTSTYLGDNKVRKETKALQGGEEEIVKELEQKFGIRREACFYPEGSVFYGVDWSKETL
ncbi:arylamine N-acetyltransferase, pineal gland isozyme NAT-3-like [Orbicella faveolata]|uniref:arylamine N-acetyltransferase, pineal gland isozyme NAT-3-like n=1 Tax=Orbicella faveolata TaxID=48498 RepID=UPI0009E2522F|nr:arylamine N-acetyltransferase, pineal gland isozyme NAT-3-like [Orbicella faveolata]